jgi:hypothetical protein
MNTAYRSPSAICRLDHLVDAEWLSSPNATLRLLFAAPGFAQLRTVDVAEPYASALWRQIQPAEDVTEEPPPTGNSNGNGRPWGHRNGTALHANPAPAPAAEPPPDRDKPRGQWGNGHRNGNGRAAPAPRPAVQSSYSPGYRTGNGGGRAVIEGSGGPPTRANQLFPWAMKMSERSGGQVDLVGYLEQWGAGQGFPRRFKDWSGGQVEAAVAEAHEFLREQGVDP